METDGNLSEPAYHLLHLLLTIQLAYRVIHTVTWVAQDVDRDACFKQLWDSSDDLYLKLQPKKSGTVQIKSCDEEALAELISLASDCLNHLRMSVRRIYGLDNESAGKQATGHTDLNLDSRHVHEIFNALFQLLLW